MLLISVLQICTFLEQLSPSWYGELQHWTALNVSHTRIDCHSFSWKTWGTVSQKSSLAFDPAILKFYKEKIADAYNAN